MGECLNCPCLGKSLLPAREHLGLEPKALFQGLVYPGRECWLKRWVWYWMWCSLVWAPSGPHCRVHLNSSWCSHRVYPKSTWLLCHWYGEVLIAFLGAWVCLCTAQGSDSWAVSWLQLLILPLCCGSVQGTDIDVHCLDDYLETLSMFFDSDDWSEVDDPIFLINPTLDGIHQLC